MSRFAMIFRRALLALLISFAFPAQALAVYEGFEIKNVGSAAFAAQTHVFAQDLQIVADGARGQGVVYAAGACAVLPQASPNMTVRLTTGCTIVSQLTTATVATGNVTIAAADGTNPRIDIVSVDNAGTKVPTPGTPAASPVPPTIPQSGGVNNVVLAFVYVPAADTAIQANQITDKRIFVNTPGVGSGAATTLGFVTKTAEGTLSNEFALGSLATGLVQNTVTTGVPTTIAPTDDNVVIGNGTTWQLKALPSCSGSTDALAYTTATNTVSCTTIATAGTALGYLTKTAEGTLSNEFALGSLATGLLVNTVTTGVPTVLVPTDDSVTVGNGTAWELKALPTCSGGTSALTYNIATNAFGCNTIAGGGDFSSNTATSVDSEFLLFSGTAGKTGKRATGTGLARAASGVASFAELSGDMITSGSNAVTISANAVTYAKMQDVSAASRVLCRGSAAGGGDPQECTLGSGLTMTGTTLSASGGGGNPETWAVVAADVTHAQSSTTLSNITGLAVSVCAASTEVWQIEVQLITVAANNSADWKFGWTFPTGMTGFWGGQSTVAANDDWGATAAAGAQNPLLTQTATPTYGSAAVTGGYRFQGTFYCSSTSGTLQLQFAQATSNASDNTIKKGSLMIARKVIS